MTHTKGPSAFDVERDKNHSLRVALMAAEATLALCGSVNAKLPEYIEDRRAETHRIVKAALRD